MLRMYMLDDIWSIYISIKLTCISLSVFMWFFKKKKKIFLNYNKLWENFEFEISFVSILYEEPQKNTLDFVCEFGGEWMEVFWK